MQPLSLLSWALCFSALQTVVAARIKIGDDCSAEMQTVIQRELQEAVQMLMHASERLSVMAELYRNPSSNAFIEKYWSIQSRSLRLTFQNLIYNRPGIKGASPKPNSRNEAVEKATKLSRLAKVMSQNIQNDHLDQDNVEIRCNTMWLFLTGAYTALDHRDPERPHSLMFGPQQNPFQDSKHRTALVLNGLNPPYSSVVLLNVSQQASWAKNWDRGLAVSTMGLLALTTEYDRLTLHELMDRYLSATLVRTLSEAYPIARSDETEPLLECRCGHANPLHPGYTWLCVVAMAKYDGGASMCSLNFGYLVVALFLDGQDWSTGINQPVTVLQSISNPDESGTYPPPPSDAWIGLHPPKSAHPGHGFINPSLLQAGAGGDGRYSPSSHQPPQNIQPGLGHNSQAQSGPQNQGDPDVVMTPAPDLSSSDYDGGSSNLNYDDFLNPDAFDDDNGQEQSYGGDAGHPPPNIQPGTGNSKRHVAIRWLRDSTHLHGKT